MDEYEDAKALFVALRGMGIHTAIDDFGAGYSVLNSILDIPVDTMKLDRAFIANCTTSEKKVYFLQSLIRMIHGLGYRVVCEGVETRGAGRLPARGRLRRGARLLLRPPAAFGRVRSVGVPGGVGAAGCRGRQKDSQTANRRPARSSVRTAENAEWRLGVGGFSGTFVPTKRQATFREGDGVVRARVGAAAAARALGKRTASEVCHRVDVLRAHGSTRCARLAFRLQAAVVVDARACHFAAERRD